MSLDSPVSSAQSDEKSRLALRLPVPSHRHYNLFLGSPVRLCLSLGGSNVSATNTPCIRSRLLSM